jgi:hypothetical protein
MIEFREKRYKCNKLGTEVIITYISDLNQTTDCPITNKIIFHAFDCDGRHGCEVTQWSNGEKIFDWQNCEHPDLFDFKKLKN